MTTVTGDWLTRVETQTVMALLTDAGHAAYLVGGCVRNALLDAPVDDIDICTDALPNRVMALAKTAGIKAIPTGIDHGTVTLMAGGIPHEVTTYRADVETDGRHAVVRFSTDMTEDAKRRDFTMNALYADRSGSVLDPVGGLPDLAVRRVRFINDPAQRIAEDYLRILRYFRFNAWYGDPVQGFDPEALAAIADALEGLDTLSRERVGQEITKLLRAPDPVMAVSVMHQIGVLTRCLPGADPKAIGPLVHWEAQTDTPPSALRRLASLGFFDGSALRLSKADQRGLTTLQTLIGGTETPAALGYFHGPSIARDVILLRAAMFEIPVTPDAFDQADTGTNATCPVTAKDLMPEFSGRALGERLKALEAAWVASGFSLDKAALLSLG